ncbi:uncharacterized protein LOC6729199 [Drosophila simulans]|uniref:GD18404 n=2 Tax=melanogaster subgroup TaxID=32351 RepID=B4R1D7_DROSI|nr:uncharacterized protein LOC6729199 [Drosophila simulans]XP_033166491.1 uncharacterized protein LOC117145083 [Drosophila mauritiana]EDX14023.1 GD18404 [Drosophila simulans]KMZ05259.1 uncharacterized protein Dsimw501_GD18404 [Drosophila simulans]
MNVCRLCLSKEANFAVFGANGSTALRIMVCTSLEIEPGDGLPQHICTMCRLRLEEMHCFRRRCLAADRKLRRHKALQLQGVKSQLSEVEEERGSLCDVEGCTPTACSENNAQWRQQAAQLISSEIDAYKKELLSTCKQAVRADIELELRAELEEVIIPEAKQQLRLSVLDDVFVELERYFVRKRNEVTYEMKMNSSSPLPVEQSAGFYEADIGEELREQTDNSVVELLDDEPEASRQPAATPLVAVPMVEINMNDPQLSHLRNDFSKETFLGANTTALKDVKTPSPCRKKVRLMSPKQKTENLCRKHSSFKKRCPSSYADFNSCVRCRLRGADKLNSTVT